MTGIDYSKFRRIEDMLENSAKAMEVISKTGHVAMLMMVQCSRVLALALRGEFAEAGRYIGEAEKIAITRKQGVVFYSTYLVTKIHLELAKIKSRGTGSYSQKEWKHLLKTTKEAIRYSKKFAGNLTEAYRLSGEALYLSGNPVMALKYFARSIAFGTRSGSKIELSRAYFELGKMLSSPDIKHNRFNGLTAKEYLEKARAMFEEMGLEWDLWELRKFFG
jgi:tetratricopeptide (TPR) repeat protein